MTDLVVWNEPDQHGQTFGTAGRIQMFIVGPEKESGHSFRERRNSHWRYGTFSQLSVRRPKRIDQRAQRHEYALFGSSSREKAPAPYWLTHPASRLTPYW